MNKTSIAFLVDPDCDPVHCAELGKPRRRFMIFVPLPFVVTLFLIVVLLQLVRHAERWTGQVAAFMALIAAYALQSILVGLRWGYGINVVMPLQIVLATLIAALAWVSFRGLTSEGAKPLWWSWPHVLPACLIALLLVFWRAPIEIVIQATFIAYGLALLNLARGGPDVLVVSRLDGSVMSYRALIVTALALLGSVITDLFISFDMMTNNGAYSASIVAGANVITLLLLGGAATAASLGQTPVDEETGLPKQPEDIVSTNEDAAVAVGLDGLMENKQLYRDADLNLGRIARRMGLPTRRISTAVNRIHSKSISQYVNDYRVTEARRLLVSTDEPVTWIMFEAGFQTKSNFNREFLRVTGMSPSDFRRAREKVADIPDRHLTEAPGLKPLKPGR